MNSSEARKIELWSLILLMVAIAIGLILIWLLIMPKPNKNSLAIGENAKVDEIDITIQSPVELDFKTKDEIFQFRREVTNRYPQLLENAYHPSDAVFGQIVDGIPWWGIEGQFFYGSGERSIVGVSEESRFILNPYLLVAVEFRDWWQGRIAEEQLSAFPLFCNPNRLQWRPRDKYAVVSYASSCIAERINVPFDLIAYNARDLNLNYIYVSYENSIGISKNQQPKDPYRNPQFLHQGNSCGYPGGCNNMSPYTPEIDGLEVVSLPAKIEIWLWNKKPLSLEQKPDMKYLIYFE